MTKAELHKLVDELPDGAVEGASVLLRGIIEGPIDPDQAWFWTPEWQAKEREADEDLAAGRGVVFGSDEEFIEHLKSVRSPDQIRCRRTRNCLGSSEIGSDSDLSNARRSSPHSASSSPV